MSTLSFLGLGKPFLDKRHDDTWPAMLTEETVLRRVLNFTRYTLDDVINDPYARFQVCGYYRLYITIDRMCNQSAESLQSEDAPI